MNKKIAAVIIVAIIIIAAVAAVFYYEDSKSNETSPLTGEWKLADEHGVDSEGNFMSHNETAETAVSPIFETIIVSANPTVTANSCSIIKGIINFFRFLFEKRLFTSTILSIKFNYSKVFFPFDIFKLNNSWFV